MTSHPSRFSEVVAALGPEWDKLISRSDVDPLFNSRSWLTNWWDQYGGVIGGTAEILQAREDGQLIGIICLARQNTVHRLGIEASRLELLGTARGASGVAFSERTEFIIDQSHQERAIESLLRQLLEDANWGELVVSYTPQNSKTHQSFQHLAAASKSYLRVADSMEAWELPLASSFEQLMAGLGSGTRQRILGSRQRLAKTGAMRERILGLEELDEGMEIFSRLHLARWNRPFSEHWRQFYGAIAAEQAKANKGIPVMSVLEFEGEPVSLLINFRAAKREYSIASAFVPVPVKRVSPGWLHLGLAIERACSDGMETFDFLGGEGKNEQYKAAFGGRAQQLLCLQLLRDKRLKLFYRAWDEARRIRSWLGRST